MRLRTLIVDDEPLAVQRLKIMSQKQPDIEIVGVAADGASALRLLAELRPDLLLLDIAMPGMNGIQVAHAIGAQPVRPAVVFITAFQEFAVAAFDVAAVDYLLKPVSLDRLSRAVARVIRRAATASDTSANNPAGLVKEFWVPHRSEIIRIAASDVDFFKADRDYLRLHVGGRSFLMHQKIGELELRLDPKLFIRFHRSTIIARRQLIRLRHEETGAWSAILTNGQIIRIGRTYLQRVRAITGR